MAIGFRALLIDRFSTLGANPAPDVGPDVEGVLGPPNVVSADGRYALFDLHRFADEVGATGLGARAAAALAAT